MKQTILDTARRIIILSGHYGSGKTSLAVHLARLLAGAGRDVTIADLDLVNPYFRTADFRQLFDQTGVRLLAPPFANSNLDIPALPPGLDEAIQDRRRFLILDVGGDDAGAVALGQLAAKIAAQDYDLCYVMNFYRYLTQTAEEAVSVLREIEAACRLKATRLIHNSNLGTQTTREDICRAQPLAEQAAALSGVPLWFTAVPQFLPCTGSRELSVTIHSNNP